MIAGTQIVYKLKVNIRFLFASYKNDGIKTYQKVQEHLLTKPLQKNKKMQFVSILIELIRLIYIHTYK